MNTTSKTVEWGPYKVEVGEATVLVGMRRQSMRALALAQNQDSTDTDLRYLRLVYFPDLMAATTGAEGFQNWPITFEEFIALPERFVNLWEAAVYELNPHWLPGFNPEKEKKKEGKARTNSLKGS